MLAHEESFLFELAQSVLQRLRADPGVQAQQFTVSLAPVEQDVQQPTGRLLRTESVVVVDVAQMLLAAVRRGTPD